jgi:hypothetical protein
VANTPARIRIIDSDLEVRRSSTAAKPEILQAYFQACLLQISNSDLIDEVARKII